MTPKCELGIASENNFTIATQAIIGKINWNSKLK